jgi:hypothetical protein
MEKTPPINQVTVHPPEVFGLQMKMKVFKRKAPAHNARKPSLRTTKTGI